MPEDPNEEDFKCFTCSLSRFQRRHTTRVADSDHYLVPDWDASYPEKIPELSWKDGKGVAGGWTCLINGDCRFLEGGEERGW